MMKNYWTTYLRIFVLGSDKMKEYIVKEIKENKYEYGYNLQKLDIKTMLDLGLDIPTTIREKYTDKYEDKDYIYFKDPISVEFISRQYYIKDLVEYSNMNAYEIELLINYYEKSIIGIEKIVNKTENKERLFDLDLKLVLLMNELKSLKYLKEELEKNKTR